MVKIAYTCETKISIKDQKIQKEQRIISKTAQNRNYMFGWRLGPLEKLEQVFVQQISVCMICYSFDFFIIFESVNFKLVLGQSSCYGIGPRLMEYKLRLICHFV